MIESVVELMRPTMMALGTGGVLIAFGILISERRNNRRTEAHPDQPDSTDPEGKR